MKWPRIPTKTHGAGGPIRIKLVQSIKRDGVACWGIWDDSTRTVTLDRTARVEHKWRILFHELTHAALDDAGISNLLSKEAVESLCDAMANSRLQEMRAQL